MAASARRGRGGLLIAAGTANLAIADGSALLYVGLPAWPPGSCGCLRPACASSVATSIDRPQTRKEPERERQRERQDEFVESIKQPGLAPKEGDK